MPSYYSLGKIPRKRHTIYRKPDGNLYAEQLVSTEGFSDNYSLTYHCYPPTRVSKIDKPYSAVPEIAEDNNMQHRSFLGMNVVPKDDFLESRVTVLVNNDIHISLAAPVKSMSGLFLQEFGCR